MTFESLSSLPLRQNELFAQVKPLLMQVEHPARYVGGEFNQCSRERVKVRCCLAFPDVYEIGMSYHGFSLLYERINKNPDWAAERTYAPWPDFEELLRQHKIPLYSLETKRPLGIFDWIGFSLQHELNMTNVLNMLDLAGLPIESALRHDAHPIIIAGAAGAYTPEPLAPFIDAFVLGDGESAVDAIMGCFEQAKANNLGRSQILLDLAKIQGIYVPAFYTPRYHDNGMFAELCPIPQNDFIPPKMIHKRTDDIYQDSGATCPIVPLMRTVHDRLTVEIRRGCINGCRFCQAGMINRPIRERSIETIVETIDKALEATGYDSVSLLSLSSADYTAIHPLIRTLSETFGPKGVSVSLPSLRINGFDTALADELLKVRKSGFTFAPEAGSEILRRIINKPVDQEHFLKIIDDVFRRGWRTIKFYFMLGLPGETQNDLDGIIEICQLASTIGRKHHHSKATINVTLSPFSPKPHTPFQWAAQLPKEIMMERFYYVRNGIRDCCGKNIGIKFSDAEASFLEATLARGDRQMADAVKRAWQLGARFDGWREHFRPQLWEQAFSETKLDPTFYANREREENEAFPWDHLCAGPTRSFLLSEKTNASKAQSLIPCIQNGETFCTGCGACHSSKHHLVKAPSLFDKKIESPEKPASPSGNPIQRIRLFYKKQDSLRYLSHLDFAKALGLIFRRAQIPITLTQGFNPTLKIQYAPPLSLGMSGEYECIDAFLSRQSDLKEVLNTLHNIQLDGLSFFDIQEIPLNAPSLEAQIAASCYCVHFKTPLECLDEIIDRFQNSKSWIVEVEKKGQLKSLDLHNAIRFIRRQNTSLLLAINHASGCFIKPHLAAEFLCGRKAQLGIDVEVARFGFYFFKPAAADMPPDLQYFGASIERNTYDCSATSSDN